MSGKPPESTLCPQPALPVGLIRLQVTEKAILSDLREQENLIHVLRESKCEEVTLKERRALKATEGRRRIPGCPKQRPRSGSSSFGLSRIHGLECWQNPRTFYFEAVFSSMWCLHSNST